jgi:hypothetical protein
MIKKIKEERKKKNEGERRRSVKIIMNFSLTLYVPHYVEVLLSSHHTWHLSAR